MKPRTYSKLMIKSIRNDAAPEEKQLFLAAYSSIWNHPDNLPFLSSTFIAFSDEQIRAWLESTDEKGPFRYFYFLKEDAIAGILVAKYDVLDGAEILGLGVHPDYKGKSIGASLLDHAIDAASRLGFKAIAATVFADNTRMQRLVLGRQFRPVSIEPGKRDDGMSLVTYKKCGL